MPTSSDVPIPQCLSLAHLAPIPAGANLDVDNDGWSDDDSTNHSWAYLGQTDNFHPPDEPKID